MLRSIKHPIIAAMPIAVAALAMVPSARADVIIIRAIGPSAPRYTAGRSLPDSTRLVLLRGDQIVLLDAHGTRTVVGPGTFPAAAAVVDSGSRLIALASNTGDRRNRVGAVRNLPTDAATLRPNIFMIDVKAPGNLCIVDPANATMWRAMADTPGTTTIAPVAAPGGAVAKVAWIKGQSSQPWPASLPVVAGGSYSLSQSNDGPPTTLASPTLASPKLASRQSLAAPVSPPITIAFQPLAAPPADMAQLAKALIANHCAGQIDVMVAATSTPAP